MKCKYCGTEPNNATTKKGLYVCCCYMLHLENGEYTQYHKDREADHPTEKCGSCEWAMPVKGTINGVYVNYIECQNPEKVWNHNSSRRKKRTTPKCRLWQPKKKGGEQE